MRKRPNLERFEEKFVRGAPDACWEWTASLNGDGYGCFGYRGDDDICRVMGAHVVAYLLYVGPVPAGREIDHKCRNRACVNPRHLRAVTHRKNTLSGDTITARNAAKTHCPSGHVYAKHAIMYDGRRYCGACQRGGRKSNRRGLDHRERMG